MHYTSNHPKSIFKAIVQSQNILPDMHYISDHLKSIFKAIVQSQNILPDMHYTSNHPKSVFKAIVYPYQACPVIPNKPKFQPKFIITFNPHNPPPSKWLKTIHFILMTDTKMSKNIPQPSFS